MAKTKRTAENRAIILECAALGMSDKDCYAIVGMSHQCFYNWIKEDSEFCEDIARERLTGKRRLIERIIKSASSDARHAEWLLAHRWPDDFSEKRVMEVRGDEKCPHERLLEALANIEKDALSAEQEDDVEEAN